MSVRNALLALVQQSPSGVYRLKQKFEDQTGGAWPLNIGQVYQTMQRLERDGLVSSHPEKNAGRDSEVFTITPAGAAVLDAWWKQPVSRAHTDRDELVIKVAAAAADPRVDVAALVAAQREATTATLAEILRLKAAVDETELAWALILDRHVLELEAELTWLDRVAAGGVTEADKRDAFGAKKGRTTTHGGASGCPVH